MRTEKEIRAEIADVEKAYKSVLTGSTATILINAPRALMQLTAQTKLGELYWVLGEKYESKLKGVDR